MAQRSASRARGVDFNLNEVLTGTSSHFGGGDRIQLFSITDINDQVVEITGAVDQPGTFELRRKFKPFETLFWLRTVSGRMRIQGKPNSFVPMRT